MPSSSTSGWVSAIILTAVLSEGLPSYADTLEDESSYIEHERAESDYHTGRQIADNVDVLQQPLPQVLKEQVKLPFCGTLAYNAFSQYNSYGIVIQPKGVSSQPFLNLRYTAHKTDKPNALLNSATVFLTTWSDFSSNRNLSNPSSKYAYFTETDIIIGTSLILLNRLDATLQLVSYVSPAGAYGFGSWARGTLLYNDSKASSNFSLKPQVSLVYTFPAASSISLIPGALLIEPGISSNLNTVISKKYQANLSFPIRVGLGSKFFASSTFGFTLFGPQLSIRLPQLSGKTFSTNLNAGYLYYYLGSTAAAFASNGQNHQNVYNLGISINF